MNQSSFSEYLTNPSFTGKLPEQLFSGWQSPSNIALIKFWGKRPGQIPMNPSLSMTLQLAFTQTTVEAILCDGKIPEMVINGDPSHPFRPKLTRFLSWLAEQIPVLKMYSFRVETRNSFPHSTGIASSASGLSAFTLCLLSVAAEAVSLRIPEEHLLPQASFAARMGSGSACRSMYGGYSVWGKTEMIPCASDLEALPVSGIVHPDLRCMRDAILVISRKPKSLTSSKGHETMNGHPFAACRTAQVNSHFLGMLEALKSGDLEQVGLLAEAEAMALHALLMTAADGTVLLEPASLEAIQIIRNSRSHGLPLFFTLDAGPNLHILFPETNRVEVESFIENELVPLCAGRLWICDYTGKGPERIGEITITDNYPA